MQLLQILLLIRLLMMLMMIASLMYVKSNRHLAPTAADDVAAIATATALLALILLLF
jgi:hypothetical protein